MCVRHGVDIIGFVADYPRPVPWDLYTSNGCAASNKRGIQAVIELMQAVSRPVQTCIVTGGSVEKILKLALEAKPNYIQLHCNETLEDTAYISETLAKHGIKIIKTLFPDTPELEKTATKFSAAGVHALLLDPRTPDNAVDGGSVNLSMYRKIQQAVSCPVILAGGITPENVKEIVLQSEASMIDLMTGVESSPGIKDEAKVIKLFQAMKALA